MNVAEFSTNPTVILNFHIRAEFFCGVSISTFLGRHTQSSKHEAGTRSQGRLPPSVHLVCSGCTVLVRVQLQRQLSVGLTSTNQTFVKNDANFTAPKMGVLVAEMRVWKWGIPWYSVSPKLMEFQYGNVWRNSEGTRPWPSLRPPHLHSLEPPRCRNSPCWDLSFQRCWRVKFGPSSLLLGQIVAEKACRPCRHIISKKDLFRWKGLDLFNRTMMPFLVVYVSSCVFFQALCFQRVSRYWL